MNSVANRFFYRARYPRRCFDSLAVSNNIRYFYHITAPVRFVAFIRVGTRFGTRRLEISRDSRALLRLPLVSRPRYIPLTLSTRHFMNERLSPDVRARNGIQSKGEFQWVRFSSEFIHSIIARPLASASQPVGRNTCDRGAYIFSPFNIFIFDLFSSRLTTSGPVGIITHKK